MAYVKFIDEKTIEYPPINKDGIINYNLDIDRLISDGYKVLVPVERPETTRKYEIRYENVSTVNEIIYYLETEEEWQARLLAEAKENKRQENSTKRNAIDRIKCSFSEELEGYLLRFTPVGDIMTVVMGLALPAMISGQSIPACVMRYYDDQNQPHLTPEIAANYVSTFYQSLVQNISKIDAYSTIIEQQINNAETLEEVNEIEINYNNIEGV